jgi:hypothetical protein
MRIVDLPKDLKNIVSDFAFGTNWKTVEQDLQKVDEIIAMRLNSIFLKSTMWSRLHFVYVPSPLYIFAPICTFSGSWEDVIDWHVVNELLWRLDFRRKYVRSVASRRDWRNRFLSNWRTISHFDDFYTFLLVSRVPCFKPIWKRCGFNCVKMYPAPFCCPLLLGEPAGFLLPVGFSR